MPDPAPATVTSPSGRTLQNRGTKTTTPKASAAAKEIKVALDKKTRLEENEAYLATPNVKAYLVAISKAEGGAYDFKYGAVAGKKNDKWRFTDTSTHPGAGAGGSTTAAGMYQINIGTWREHGGKMGLTDFTPKTQDLIAVDILRSVGVIDQIKAGNIAAAMPKASYRWAALPQGPGKAGRYPKQHSVSYEDFVAAYKAAGGTVK